MKIYQCWDTIFNSLISVSKLYTRHLDQVVYERAASQRISKDNINVGST